MPDQLRDPAAGPGGMFSTDHPPTRGQLHAIATLAADLLDFKLDTRYDATLAQAQLQQTIRDRDARADENGTAF